MITELFVLNGYGLFVWSAFIFTFVSCSTLYLKTKKELKKQEAIFSIEYKQEPDIQIKVIKKNLSGSTVY
jgi:heme exporter protein D|tara:strand:- start:4212 stop:4421 length:210 start_codon:yes stop_codon:yes gene_type:complete